MNQEKLERLAAAGYVSTTVAEFLGLTQEQSDLIEIKLALTYGLRGQRKISGLSQTELAKKINSSQSRIAKMEAGDPHVSLDQMIRALLAAGMTRGELAGVIAGQPPSAENPAPPSRRNGAGRKQAAKTQVPEPQAVEA